MTDNFLEMFGTNWPKPQAAGPEEIPIAGLDDPLERLTPPTGAADERIAFAERVDLFQEISGMEERTSVEFMKSVSPPTAAATAPIRPQPIERTGRRNWLRLGNERTRAQREGRLAEWQKETGLP